MTSTRSNNDAEMEGTLAKNAVEQQEIEAVTHVCTPRDCCVLDPYPHQPTSHTPEDADAAVEMAKTPSWRSSFGAAPVPVTNQGFRLASMKLQHAVKDRSKVWPPFPPRRRARALTCWRRR